MNSSADQHWMQRAIDIAHTGLYTTRVNPTVGCVLVRDETCIAEGYHVYPGEAHAERVALDLIANQANGATAYVSLEPCSHTGKTGPCADALIAAGVSRVVIAMQDPNPAVNGQGVAKLRAAGVEVGVGLLAEQAEELNKGFCYSMRHGRPYVRAKLAMSIDGKTALSNGESKWITGPQAREDVQHLRARSGAIITGRGTVEKDQPRMTVRQEDWTKKWPHAIAQPLRVMCSSQDNFNLPAGWVLENGSPAEALANLQQQHIHDVLVEAGPTLSGAFIEASLVNELWIYMAPCLLGPGANPLLHIADISDMNDKRVWQLHDVKQIDQDVRLIYRLI